MKTNVKVTNKKTFEKLVESVNCENMIGYVGKVEINLKNGKQLVFNKAHEETTYKNKYGFIFEIEGNVFDRLQEIGACYAVGVAMIVFKSKGSGLNSKDYYIIASKRNETELKNVGLKFYDSKDKNYDTIERTLKDSEVKIFKGLQNEFVKVKHDADGRVYELKNNSFKKFYSGVGKNKVAEPVN